MKKLSVLLFLLASLIACKKNEVVPGENVLLNGRYAGTFSRTAADTVNVSILFTGSDFSGTGDRLKYPAICNGTFLISKNGTEQTIHFSNACAWTADFDWTLILNGDYELVFNTDKKITIRRSNGYITDEYNLYKAIR
jgi:hypothetical protein